MIYGMKVTLKIACACVNKMTIILTHDNVPVTLFKEEPSANACWTYFSVDAVNTIFSDNKQFYSETQPEEPLSHFFLYNGTGDWKFEFINEAATVALDANVSYIEIDL